MRAKVHHTFIQRDRDGRELGVAAFAACGEFAPAQYTDNRRKMTCKRCRRSLRKKKK